MDSDMNDGSMSGDAPDEDDDGDYIDGETEDAVNAIDALWHPESGRNYKADRNAVEHMLALAANGGRDDDDFDVIFMRQLAAALLAAGGRGSPAEDRANNVLRACGLAGKYDEDTDTVRFMNSVRELGLSTAEAIHVAREIGMLNRPEFRGGCFV